MDLRANGLVLASIALSIGRIFNILLQCRFSNAFLTSPVISPGREIPTPSIYNIYLDLGPPEYTALQAFRRVTEHQRAARGAQLY